MDGFDAGEILCYGVVEDHWHTSLAKLKSFSAKIVQLLKEWTEAFSCDFQDEKAMVEPKTITHRVTQCDEENGTVNKAISQMTQSLLL